MGRSTQSIENRRERQREYDRRYIRKNPLARSEAVRRHKLKQYGLTITDYDALLEQQNGGCAICGSTDPKGRWGRFCVDHDHQTDVVRGLLCTPCNIGIGNLQDTPYLMRRTADYLENA